MISIFKFYLIEKISHRNIELIPIGNMFKIIKNNKGDQDGNDIVEYLDKYIFNILH